jgi:hypothetical protein
MVCASSTPYNLVYIVLSLLGNPSKAKPGKKSNPRVTDINSPPPNTSTTCSFKLKMLEKTQPFSILRKAQLKIKAYIIIISKIISINVPPSRDQDFLMDYTEGEWDII